MKPWIKLHRSMYAPTSTIAEVAARNGMATYAYWPAICMMAANASTPGRFRSTCGGLRRALCDTTLNDGQVRDILTDFEKFGLVKLEEIGYETEVTVLGLEAAQRTTNAEHVANSRSRMRLHSVPDDGDSLFPDLSSSLEEGEGEGEEEGTTSPAVSPKPTPRGPSASSVAAVFDYWKQTFGVAAQAKLTDARGRRIKWALTNYSAADIRHCLQGYANDEWPERRASLARHDLTLLFRNDEKVEHGLDLYRRRVLGQALTPAAAAQSVDERLRRSGWV